MSSGKDVCGWAGRSKSAKLAEREGGVSGGFVEDEPSSSKMMGVKPVLEDGKLEFGRAQWVPSVGDLDIEARGREGDKVRGSICRWWVENNCVSGCVQLSRVVAPGVLRKGLGVLRMKAVPKLKY